MFYRCIESTRGEFGSGAGAGALWGRASSAQQEEARKDFVEDEEQGVGAFAACRSWEVGLLERG